MTGKRSATLVVIEYGATWPRWLNPARSAAGDLAVVAQHYEGAPISLVTQVASRITRLEQNGWELCDVVVVSNGRMDPDGRGAREVLCRGLLARMHQAGGGRLVLTVDPCHGERPQRALESLAKQLNAPATRSSRSQVALAS